MRCSGLRVERPGLKQRKRCGCPERSTSPAFGRHYRALPQRLVVIPVAFRGARLRCGAKPPSSTFRRGNGRLLPWGSVPFGVRAWAIVVSVCLSDTLRSQSFSLSQRFEPARALWLCFAPHPPLGFVHGLQSFSRSASRDASRRPLPSCRCCRCALALRLATSGRCSDRASVPG
jgi:hypothetical protein